MWHWECKKHGDGERYLLGVVGTEECPLCRLEKLEPVLEAVMVSTAEWDSGNKQSAYAMLFRIIEAARKAGVV